MVSILGKYRVKFTFRQGMEVKFTQKVQKLKLNQVNWQDVLHVSYSLASLPSGTPIAFHKAEVQVAQLELGRLLLPAPCWSACLLLLWTCQRSASIC